MNSGPLDLGRALEGYPVRTLRYPETSFNYSTSCNLGAAHAGGDYLLFLNDDTEVITPAWLEQMLRYARQPGIGAVGAKLFFADGRLQHAGVALVDGAPGHPHYGAPGNAEGDFAFTMTPRHCLAVTGACLMTSRRLFNEVGGFDRRFPLNYNDVDYCLRLHQRGLRIVFTPHAQLYHYERASRGKQTPIQPSELALFKRIWSGHYPRDPYYHPGC